jgi:hypothetical protein
VCTTSGCPFLLPFDTLTVPPRRPPYPRTPTPPPSRRCAMPPHDSTTIRCPDDDDDDLLMSYPPPPTPPRPWSDPHVCLTSVVGQLSIERWLACLVVILLCVTRRDSAVTPTSDLESWILLRARAPGWPG